MLRSIGQCRIDPSPLFAAATRSDLTAQRVAPHPPSSLVAAHTELIPSAGKGGSDQAGREGPGCSGLKAKERPGARNQLGRRRQWQDHRGHLPEEDAAGAHPAASRHVHRQHREAAAAGAWTQMAHAVAQRTRCGSTHACSAESAKLCSGRKHTTASRARPAGGMLSSKLHPCSCRSCGCKQVEHKWRCRRWTVLRAVLSIVVHTRRCYLSAQPRIAGAVRSCGCTTASAWSWRRSASRPACTRSFDEILVNAADNKARDPRMDILRVDIDPV